MNAFTFSSLLIFVSSLIIGLFALWKGRDRKLSIILSLFCLSASMWGLGCFKSASSNLLEEAEFWRKIANIAVIFSPVLFFHFVYSFLKLKTKFNKISLLAAYILGFLFLVLNFFAPDKIFFGGMRFVFNQFYYSDWFIYKSFLYLLFHISFYWLMLPFALLLLLLAYRTSKGLVRNQLRYIIIGSIIGWLGPAFMWMIEFRIDIYPYSNFLTAIYPAIWVYAIIRYQLLDIKTVIHRTILWALTSAIVFVPIYFLLVLFRQSRLMKMSDTIIWLIVVGLLIIFNLYQKYIQPRINYIFRRKKYDYRITLKNLAFEIGMESNIDTFANKLLQSLKKNLFVQNGFLLVKLSAPSNYVRISDFGYENNNLGKDLIISSSPLVQWFKDKKSGSLSWDLLEVDPYFQDVRDEVKSFFQTNKLALLIPLLATNDVIGFIGLGEKDDTEGWATEDESLLAEIGKQIGIIFQNFIYQKELRKEEEETQRKLEKLVADRTSELEAKSAELEKFNKFMTGRELKIIELKQKVEELEKKAGGGS